MDVHSWNTAVRSHKIANVTIALPVVARTVQINAMADNMIPGTVATLRAFAQVSFLQLVVSTCHVCPSVIELSC